MNYYFPNLVIEFLTLLSGSRHIDVGVGVDKNIGIDRETVGTNIHFLRLSDNGIDVDVDSSTS